MGDVETARRAMRKPYYFCRYVPTGEIKPSGRGYRAGDIEGALYPVAPSYVYRLKREGAALWLLDQEAKAIQDAMTEEGQPHLLPEHEAIEGKAL